MNTEKLTSGQLYDLWQARIKEEKYAEVLKNNEGLETLRNFLQGKKYLKERCRNSAVTYYYECDETHKIEVVENKWCRIHNLRNYRIVATSEIEDDADHIDFAIDYEYENSNTSKFFKRDRKAFHFNDLSNISEISIDEFRTVAKAFEEVSKILLNINV